MARQQQYDVLVIGSGAAGLTLALHLADRMRVAVLSKGRLSEGSTFWAQGGVAAVLDDALSLIEDHFTEEFRRQRDLPALSDAYRMMHRPVAPDEITRARRRLAYDELFFLQLSILRERAARLRQSAPALTWNDEIDSRIRARIPFSFTKGQDAAVADIAADLQRDFPANRLVQGDVG